MTQLDYIRRLAGIAGRDPAEFLERMRGKWEIRRQCKQDMPVLIPTGDFPGELHALIDEPYPCQVCEGFTRAWAATEATLVDRGHIVGMGYDASVDLAWAIYAVTRHLQPRHVVETGVARGVTSRIILEALRENGNGGRLHSVDLPPVVEHWHDQSTIAVPAHLRSGWDYLRGSSRRVLPDLLKSLGTLQLFIHDSLHTYANMTREITTAWAHLESGGLLICDDVECNYAFKTFAAASGCQWIVAKDRRKAGFIGAVRR
ncbi:MAG: hypothetical protein QOI36_739 [Pseudonocardiales bacterium]|jgi:hypothetical protein|nr:hypothetical protein [Pseudonocardia sp.]MDT7649333.1 hypothetical protein [Pseudonocardiales bacterium]